MGWICHWRSTKWSPSSTDLLSPMQKMPTLLPTKPGSVQGQVSKCPRKCFQAMLEASERTAYQQQGLRKALKCDPILFLRKSEFEKMCLSMLAPPFCSQCKIKEEKVRKYYRFLLTKMCFNFKNCFLVNSCLVLEILVAKYQLWRNAIMWL